MIEDKRWIEQTERGSTSETITFNVISCGDLITLSILEHFIVEISPKTPDSWDDCRKIFADRRDSEFSLKSYF